MQFWFLKHGSDTWNPKGMFSAPSGRSDVQIIAIEVRPRENASSILTIFSDYLSLNPFRLFGGFDRRRNLLQIPTAIPNL